MCLYHYVLLCVSRCCYSSLCVAGCFFMLLDVSEAYQLQIKHLVDLKDDETHFMQCMEESMDMFRFLYGQVRGDCPTPIQSNA